MKDAAIGIIAALALLCCLCTPQVEKSATLQRVFEDLEKRKADQLLREQNEQAKRTIEQQRAADENLRTQQK